MDGPTLIILLNDLNKHVSECLTKVMKEIRERKTMNTKDSNEFWNDDLVTQFILDRIPFYNNGKIVSAMIREFKASKQSVSLDWEIVSIVTKNGCLGVYGGGSLSLDNLNDPENKIYAVRRIKDGEVFTVGDNIISIYYGYNPKARTIKSFVIDGTEIMIKQEFGISHLNDVSPAPLKQPKPLFRTEDGVDIFHGGEYWQITSDWYPQKENAIEINRYLYIKLGLLQKKRFSKKEKAEEYILLNKPVLSVNDVNDTLKKLIAGYNEDSYLVKGLKEFAKSKL